MSAVKEWFGVYNMIFRHIYTTYGPKVMDEYLNHIADEANSDISEIFIRDGINAAVNWYRDNFEKDGATFEKSSDELQFTMVRCPAYAYMETSANPYDKPATYYCDCCQKLNKRICSNAGVHVAMIPGDLKKCSWTFKEQDL